MLAVAESTNPTGAVDQVLAAACEIAGLDPAGARLLGNRMNAVFRLRSAPVVARIRRQARGRVARTVRVARWLAAQAAPVTYLLEGVPQPVEVDRYAVTFWEAAVDRPYRWQGADLALPLRYLHRLDPPEDLAEWDPFFAIRARIARLDRLGGPDQDWLTQQVGELEAAYQQLRPALRWGLIHGDAHLGNLLRDRSGRVVLCDLDSVARGPLAQDLVPTAVNAIRFARMVRHRTLAYAYGSDVTRAPEWPVLRRIRELSTTVAGLVAARQRPELADEASFRLRTLQAADLGARWRGYS